MSTAIAQFASLFRGFENGHGTHELFGQPDEHGKIKGNAVTRSGGATEKDYISHLEGRGVSLGIIPLMADNTVWFGVIDIDISGPNCIRESLESLEKRVRKMELPLVFCRSKSGGAHMYMFFSEPMLAKSVHAKLSEFSAALGYAGCEIFPKQFTRVNEHDRGNWINIAFYGALSKEGTNRYCIRNGKQITKLEDFLKYADMMKVSREALKAVQVEQSEHFADGPPCLQHLATFGFEQGGRNNALINIAVYHKQKSPDDWSDYVKIANETFLQPPLPESEVRQVIANAQRKDYFYTCKIPPICNHCDKKLCKTRKFGIDGEVSIEVPKIENITKCISRESVRWYGEYKGKRFEFQTIHMTNYAAFATMMIEKHSVMGQWKHKDVLAMWAEGLTTATELIDPDDASRQGQFENLVDNFFSSSRPARNKDELIKGNSFVEGGKIHFRSEDLLGYLKIRRFDHTPHEVWMWLKSMDAADKQMRIKGRKLRVWTLPEPEKFDTSTGLDLPQQVEEEL